MASKQDLKKVFVTGAVPTESDFHDLIDVAGSQGPKGDKGDTGAAGAAGKDGAQGPKGDAGIAGKDGAAGKDGFGTEAQYNAIIARLDELEAPTE